MKLRCHGGTLQTQETFSSLASASAKPGIFTHQPVPLLPSFYSLSLVRRTSDHRTAWQLLWDCIRATARWPTGSAQLFPEAVRHLQQRSNGHPGLGSSAAAARASLRPEPRRELSSNGRLQVPFKQPEQAGADPQLGEPGKTSEPRLTVQCFLPEAQRGVSQQGTTAALWQHRDTLELQVTSLCCLCKGKGSY